MRPVGSKYLLDGEPLGRGATGTVWRARVRDDENTVVAVKVLKEELAGDPDVVMRFLRERSALVRLRHPHIVRVRDLVVEGDLLALVMDLVDGPDLHRYLRDNGPFSPVATALLTAAVADALAASHADGIVHRDLKPANVLLATTRGADGAESMHPMLTDFGIARLADSPGVTRTQEFVGTPAYVAPESARGRPQTSAVDVYGAGVLMYELLTGRPPFRGGSALEVLNAHMTEQPQRPGSAPEPLWTVIERCLRKDPEQRPSAENLARALRVVAAGVGAHATPAQAEAALGVGALLTPAADPTLVPGTGQGEPTLVPHSGDADPTQVLPSGGSPGGASAAAGYDPDATIGAMPSAGPAPSVPSVPSVPSGAPDRTRVLPAAESGPGADQGPPQAQGPHPWESQLNAARQRNEQTEVRQVPPEMDPLYRRPVRGSRQAPQAPQPPQPDYGQQGYGGRGYPQGGGPGQDRYGYPQQQSRPPQPRYQEPPQNYEPQRYAPQRPQGPAPQAPERGREPRAPRGSANPVKIPGLGCLKGCLVVILVLVVIFVVIWYTTPLPDWVNSTRNLYDATSDWLHTAWHKISAITGDSGGGDN